MKAAMQKMPSWVWRGLVTVLVALLSFFAADWVAGVNDDRDLANHNASEVSALKVRARSAERTDRVLLEELRRLADKQDRIYELLVKRD